MRVNGKGGVRGIDTDEHSKKASRASPMQTKRLGLRGGRKRAAGAVPCRDWSTPLPNVLLRRGCPEAMAQSYMPNHPFLPQEPGPFLTHAFCRSSWQSNWSGGHFGHLAVPLTESVSEMHLGRLLPAVLSVLQLCVRQTSLGMQGTAPWSKLHYEVKGRAWPPTGEV